MDADPKPLDEGVAKDLAERLAPDPRVVGTAWLPRERTLVVATTWDGLDALTAALPSVGAVLAGAGERIERTVARNVARRWEAILADGRRLAAEAVRIADLKPSARGEDAAPLHDPRGLMDQWARWSRGRRPGADEGETPRPHAAAFAADDALRCLDSVPPGSRIVRADGTAPRAVRHVAAAGLRAVRERLRGADAATPAETALAARVDAALAAMPGPGEGWRVEPTGDDRAAERLEAFLRIADGEGFKGDRVLFDAAAARLASLSGRTPVFDEGFAVATFDAVEARFRFGEGIGGCKRPLVPCVHVGVGVTPKDDLEFWAGPSVREHGCSVASTHDRGDRTVVPRTAGKDAFFDALHAAVDDAWDRLPEFVRTARRAGRTEETDPASALRPLHLPRTFAEGALELARRGGGSISRLALALSLARFGDDASPLIARKLGLAAGRLLATTPGTDDPDEPAVCP